MSVCRQKWMILDDTHQSHSSAYWLGHNDHTEHSMDNSCSRPDSSDRERSSSKKRSRDDGYGGSTNKAFREKEKMRDDTNVALTNKASREKMRRDRLNDRFLELSALLEPGKTPKTDKLAILSDALQVLKQLKTEAQQLNHSNETLRENIKELKTEKSDLRDEKQRLKAEKERLEQQMKMPMMPSGYFTHPAAMHAAMAAFAQTQPVNGEGVSVPGQLGMGTGMWRWMPSAALDTSQDHMLRPPVA